MYFLSMKVRKTQERVELCSLFQTFSKCSFIRVWMRWSYVQSQSLAIQWIKHEHKDKERARERERERGREREREDTKQLYWFLPQIRSNLVSLHFQGIFTIITKEYKCSSPQVRDFKCSSTQARDFQILNHTRKRLLQSNLIK